MKDDAPTPEKVPTKRRQLHDALPRWLAEWLARDDLTKRERALIEEEQERRRNLQPTVAVGVVIPQEGLTPQQLAALKEWLSASGATEVHHRFGMPSRVHTACRDLGVPVNVRDTDRDVVRDSTTVVATPKETFDPGPRSGGVWDTVRAARHRKVPVKLVMPDGRIE